MEHQFSREALPPTKSAPPRPTHTVSPIHTNSTFAFLVHDQDSMLNHTPPNVDNKPLVRQKRRRTNHEDQTILEEEFARDPRPDRRARDSIVARISLDHKEVHIWFQNRRQKERRKGGSLPDPRVLESRGASIDPSSSFLQPSLNRSFSMPQSSQGLLIPTPTSSFAITDSPPSSNDSSEIASVKQEAHVASGVTHCTATEAGGHTLNDTQVAESSDTSLKDSQDSIAPSAETGILASQASIEVDDTPKSCPNLPLKTELRMSFNSSGGACLLSAAEATPSPPRANPIAPTPFATRQSLRRSYSTTGVSSYRTNMQSLSSTPGVGPASSSQPQRSVEEPTKTAPLLQRQPSGRSRDSRAWAYWCDKSSRDPEVEEASAGGDGNAQHAIGLLRSRSSLGGRRTPYLGVSAPGTASREKTGAGREVKRQRLSGEHLDARAEQYSIRAHTAGDTKIHTKSRPSKKPTGLGIFEDNTSSNKLASPERTLQSPAGESDKENWGLERRREQHNADAKDKPAANARRRPALGNHHSRPLLGKSRSAVNERGNVPRKSTLSRSKSLLSRKDGPQVDGGDMELGAEALLSLSQGAWR